MLWKFNTLTEQFSLWSTLRPRNLAVESLICHYPGFCQECGTWPVWRERFLSVTNKESSEQQIPHVAQQLSQTAEMPEFSCKRCWGTFNDHSCEGLGLLFCFTESMAPSEQCVVCPPPCLDEALGLRKDEMYFITDIASSDTYTPSTPCCHPEVNSIFWVQM